MTFPTLSHTKLLISTFTSLVFSALFFAGCDTFETQKEQSFKNPYAEVGQLHNKALDSVLSDLKTVQGTVESKEELYDKAEASLQAFAKEKGATAHEIDRVRWGRKVIREAPQRLERALTNSTEGNPTPRAVAVLPDSMLGELTSEQMRYIEGIADLVDDNPSVDQFEAQLSTLSQSALDELGEEDAAVVLRASAVAKSSYSYWIEHFEEWIVAASQATSDSLTVAGKNSLSTTPTTRCDWSDGPNSGAGEAALESADDITYADLAGALAGGWGAAATSTLQAVKEGTDYMQGDTENDYGCEG